MVAHDVKHPELFTIPRYASLAAKAGRHPDSVPTPTHLSRRRGDAGFEKKRSLSIPAQRRRSANSLAPTACRAREMAWAVITGEAGEACTAL